MNENPPPSGPGQSEGEVPAGATRSWPGAWIAIGVAFGIAIGVAMDNVLLGLPIGIGLGLALDAGRRAQAGRRGPNAPEAD